MHQRTLTIYSYDFEAKLESMTSNDRVAVAVGKMAARTIRMLGAGLGSNLPGRVARKLAPDVLSHLAGQSKKGVIAVTGTNGKSTTSGLLSSVLKTAGFTLIHNRQGANLVTGITATLVDAASWDGHINTDYCLFEIDEAALPLVAKETTLSVVVVTNLFRDQLDRFGELDTTAKLIEKGITTCKSPAVLNADDPNVCQLVPDNTRLFFGLDAGYCEVDSQRIQDESNPDCSQSMELSYCLKCGAEIVYDCFFYGQLGHWRCSSCDYKRPDPTIVATHIQLNATGSRFKLTDKRQNLSVDVKLPIPGLFNVYNALAAAACAVKLGVTLESVKQGLQNYSTLFGRSEKISLLGKPVLIQLIKNPAGASQTVKAVVEDSTARVLIAINDNLADGRDISWLWDADFEPLRSVKGTVIVSGLRADDMAVRMKYAGIEPERIVCVPKLERALRQALNDTSPDETLWILPTYTCLLELQKIVKTMGQSLAGT
jgi:UDP-N-acetylmuramyl tripeptide synthase